VKSTAKRAGAAVKKAARSRKVQAGVAAGAAALVATGVAVSRARKKR
jgi:hypothetical protein